MITAPALHDIPAIRHGFCTRTGGLSTGIYEGLNTGLGSNDDRETVLANRAKVRRALGADALLTPFQIHSPDAVTVTEPWSDDQSPRADALVTATPGIAIAINTADCTPVLFASSDGTVVGAAHAGWKGAVGGVLQSTVSAMQALGTAPGDIHAAIGPTISQANYEVGTEFQARFVGENPDNARFFVNSQKPDHYMFDLPGYVRTVLDSLGLASIWDAETCTYAGETEFYSYRRTTHRNEPDYGRQMSAIVIAT